MILPDHKIMERIAVKNIDIWPVPEARRIGTCSVDLLLGSEITKYDGCEIECFDLRSHIHDIPNREINIDHGYVLQPGEFILGQTNETISLPNDIVGKVDGRSTLARLGLTVHICASTVDPGFSGKLTLEIKNVAQIPIKIYSGLRICSLQFHLLEEPVSTNYFYSEQERYMGDVVLPKINKYSMF